MKGYRELAAAKPEARSVSDMQRARLLATDQLQSIEWSLKLKALRDSGLVEERKALRDDER